MKAKIKYGSWLIVIIVVGLGMCGLFIKLGINKTQKEEDRLLKIESRLDSLEITLYPKWEWNAETRVWEKTLR